ncbi:hypothetical protein ACJMK2_023902 [Sinanodonta woodiana]|uniref:Protein kinase domain-containing protein n=1 Tax=Sinanodonta woodiana TaxID=1069815 RepID=A0ABD3T5X6_SINWO
MNAVDKRPSNISFQGNFKTVLPPIMSASLPLTTRIEIEDLKKLLNLINTPASKQQLPSINYENGQCRNKSDQWPVPQPKSGAHQHQSTEVYALEQFSSKYQNERHFSRHPNHKKFHEIFSALIKQRLCCIDWVNWAPPENILRVLMCLRILMRDSTHQKHFFDLGCVKVLSEQFARATDSYLFHGDGPFVVDILKEMTNIFQKLSNVVEQREWLIACGVHKALVLLLLATDVIVLHCSLHALISLAQSAKPRHMIGELNCIEFLLRIVQEYDSLSKKLAANLLRLLCQDVQSREMVKDHDGIPILLSQLHSDNVNLLWHIVWCLVQLCEDPDISKDIRQTGGIPLLLALLHDDRAFVTERNEASERASSAGKRTSPNDVDDAEELMEQHYSLKSACCAALTELVLNDTNAQQIAQANGIYVIGQLILPPCQPCSSKERKSAEKLQRNAFRALRFLFSMERNRRLFKRLFPADLYVMFIDIGHYNKDLSAYKPLVQKINGLPADAIKEIRETLVETNQDRTPTRYIGNYAVFEHLGSGAFGSVYKVKKGNAGQSFQALKEINILNPAFGKTLSERDQSIGDMINELQIMREQLRHPNVVRYYKTFREGEDKLFILMELIEGAPLGEHFSSLKEKKEKFTEGRIWNIFIQMVLALRYLHKEKGVVHRDLTPNNVMLGENDKVTITDFGLAKVKQADTSKMLSVCGTILYSCPEMVQHLPYGEKADIWALGCIVYQMCTLEPPFFSNNLLALSEAIVEAKYKPIPEGDYSKRLRDIVSYCITPSSSKRPDILQLAASVIDIILVHMDNMKIHQTKLETKLERERKRTQKHFVEANQNMQNYHRLFLVSQERYDKLANLADSGGASGIKDSMMVDSGNFSEQSPKQSPKLGTVLRSESRLEADDQGWTSDDESGPSSGSESRESSAGSTRSNSLPRHRNLSQLPPTPTSKGPPYQQLTVDIPSTGTSAKTSRDSGFSSGDPSPNQSNSSSAVSSMDYSNNDLLAIKNGKKLSRSHSSPAVHHLVKGNKKFAPKRPTSTSAATLTISQRRVRQIIDPILQMLHQLHKIIYISQLPPTLNLNPLRRVIEKFKRALFAPQSTSFNLKSELKKLMMGSQDMIDLNLGPVENRLRGYTGSETDLFAGFNADRLVTTPYDPDFKDVGITYEQMQSMIESVLVESGYYNMSPHARERTPPLGPIDQMESVRSRLSKKLT